MPIISIRSPRDGFVKTVRISSGDTVRSGDVLYELESIEENEALAKIALHRQGIAVEERSVSGESARRKLMEAIAAARGARALFLYAKIRHKDYLSKYEQAAVTYAELCQTKAGLIRAHSEAIKGRIALEELKLSLSSSRERLDIAKSNLDIKEAEVIRSKSKCLLIAAVDGIVVNRVGAGSFCKKGNIVGQIKTDV